LRIFPRFISYIFAILYEVVHGGFCLKFQGLRTLRTLGTRVRVFLKSHLKTKARERLRPPRWAGNSRQKLPDSTATFCVCAGLGILDFQGFRTLFDPFPSLKQAL